MIEVRRPNENLCDKCPISNESEKIVKARKPHGYPDAELIEIKQTCWVNRASGIATVGGMAVFKTDSRFLLPYAPETKGEAPKNCPQL